MTGVGKTTVGKILAQKLNFDFLDLDLLITRKTGKTPAEIFALYGEEKFREIESEELENVFRNHTQNFVLSCGGGIVLREANIETLKKNSFVVWLVRDIDEIAKTPEILSRPPINGDINNYTELFGRREKLYEKTSDLKTGCSDISSAVKNILAGMLTKPKQ